MPFFVISVAVNQTDHIQQWVNLMKTLEYLFF
jgi:hypothetical protein